MVKYPFNHGGKRKKPPITLAGDAHKEAKSEADYVNYSRTKHCEDCLMFRPPGVCTKVKGDISMVGTCRFWMANGRTAVD